MCEIRNLRFRNEFTNEYFLFVSRCALFFKCVVRLITLIMIGYLFSQINVQYACNNKYRFVISTMVGPDIVVGIQRLRYRGWTVRGSNPGEEEVYRTGPDRPWGPPSLL